MILHEKGQVITSELFAYVSEISDIVPAKFNGDLDAYVACDPLEADCYIIDANNRFIAIDVGCKNKEVLIDIV